MGMNLLTLRNPGSLARLIARKAWRRVREGRVFAPRHDPSRYEVPLGTDAIDVRDLIASATLEEHLARADRYFASLEDWTWHLAKPLGAADQAPHLLMHFGLVLQGMSLTPGLRVLDFGAGTGWTSRALSQMGCEVIVCDVSAAALRIARRLYESHPPFGSTPAPTFMHFDGRRFDLPDASVDRILCFDAFHHAPNPDEVLAEMARVLRDGGIAAFSEPGPYHSRTAQSQYEMRVHGVIENDVDMDAIAATATRVGFGKLTLAASFVGPYHVSLPAHGDLLAGGETYVDWAEAARSAMNDARTFFLVKGESIAFDSRQTRGLAGEVRLVRHGDPHAHAPLELTVEVVNTGEVVWLPSGERPGGVALGAHLVPVDGGARIADWVWSDLAPVKRRIEPGERLEVTFTTPPIPGGRWVLDIGLVSDGVAWFEQVGSKNVRLALDVG